MSAIKISTGNYSCITLVVSKDKIDCLGGVAFQIKAMQPKVQIYVGLITQ
jgi:hypothetical protein